MSEQKIGEIAQEILTSHSVTFLTGAGVSTPSGVPDYRSLKGVYAGLEQPEYLLSTQAMEHEPEKFYSFVKKLYHPQAEPNIIHLEIAQLATSKQVAVVSQNIDGLHERAGSKQLVNFHGSLYHCHCRKCGGAVAWQTYLESDRHQACGGQVRPNIVLYGEGFQQSTIEAAVSAVEQADVVVIVGTSFQVHPFCDLIEYKEKDSKIIVINQTPILLSMEHSFIQKDGAKVFQKIHEMRINNDRV
ncbi:NAD-dependent protein deacylase [Candidatus Enterococcus courvalinii]|uniref:protein acetyllysine N-acetyltransferase n=1 Tax=Candidatus Enterococcus courvalinii TaxID=2815329 RepID=A0ABS3I291_9ENTE|nr:NAD-dependent protein deacylase [Enterococcus sp. MSG2901]MBO0482822.1 NAD-dependent protein deacylase [Enterococcus sp. MSG2901]